MGGHFDLVKYMIENWSEAHKNLNLVIDSDITFLH